MSALAPICVPCRLSMRCVKNDRLVCDPEVGSCPSTYWFGDEWECSICGTRIVTGFGRAIAAEPLGGLGQSALEFDYQREVEP